jgi:hypothetical protein
MTAGMMEKMADVMEGSELFGVVGSHICHN